MKICVVLVTYNRLDLLKLALNGLLNQTYEVKKILVINNNSTDGTKEYLEKINNEKIEIINLNQNTGGAGGFYTGIKYAATKNYDYLWAMDDDTIVENDTLEKLIDGINLLSDKNERIGFVCSNVLYKDNTPCIMNIPRVEKQWNHLLENGIVKVESASFVSLLININAIKEVGLPIKEFFIWGDDVEYTRRISKSYGGYIIGKSKVKHFMKSNQETNIITDDERINRYYYDFRNSIFIAKQKGNKELLKVMLIRALLFLEIITKKNNFKLKKLSVLFRGGFSGITFNPKIEYIEESLCKEEN